MCDLGSLYSSLGIDAILKETRLSIDEINVIISLDSGILARYSHSHNKTSVLNNIYQVLNSYKERGIRIASIEPSSENKEAMMQLANSQAAEFPISISILILVVVLLIYFATRQISKPLREFRCWRKQTGKQAGMETPSMNITDQPITYPMVVTSNDRRKKRPNKKKSISQDALALSLSNDGGRMGNLGHPQDGAAFGARPRAPFDNSVVPGLLPIPPQLQPKIEPTDSSTNLM